jgi:hypothetical protein
MGSNKQRLSLGAIIGVILLLVLVYAYAAMEREARICSLKPLRSQTQLRSLVQGCSIFADSNNGMFPTQEQWPDALTEIGIVEYDLLNSPIDLGDGVSYIYVYGEDTMDDRQILIYENPKHFDEYVLVGFADAHVEMIDHETFERMLAEQLGAQALP